MKDELQPTPPEHVDRPDRPVRRILLGMVGAHVISFVLIALVSVIYDKVWGNLLGVVMMIILPLAATFILLRGSRWWVRTLLCLLNLVIFWFFLVIIMSMALSGMELAPVG
jgi:hypothetical protein